MMAAPSDTWVTKATPTVPKAYRTTMPPSTFTALQRGSDRGALSRSDSHPITKAATGKPSRNPTLGPKNTAKPPRPPDSSGPPPPAQDRSREHDAHRLNGDRHAEARYRHGRDQAHCRDHTDEGGRHGDAGGGEYALPCLHE